MSKEQDLRIVRALPDDAPELLEFIKELAEAESFPDEVTVTAEDLLENLFGSDSSAEAVIGYLGDEPVGFAVFYQTFAATTGKRGLHIDDLFVRPQVQSMGFGKQLLGYLANLARERGCGRMEWWVLEWNDQATGFYQRIGARQLKHLEIFRLAGDSLEAVAELR